MILLLNMLLSSFIFFGCSSEKEMIKYFDNHKQDIEQLKIVSEEFSKMYAFESCSIRELNTGVKFSIRANSPYKGTGGYYDPKTLDLIPYSNDTNICDSCTEKEVEIYKKMFADNRLKELLKLNLKLKPSAIQITNEGLFIALGNPIKHKNKTEVEGGIFLPFKEGFNKTEVVKQIRNESAYLYETVVE